MKDKELKQKGDKNATTLFQSIIKASVKDNPKPKKKIKKGKL